MYIMVFSDNLLRPKLKAFEFHTCARHEVLPFHTMIVLHAGHVSNACVAEVRCSFLFHGRRVLKDISCTAAVVYVQFDFWVKYVFLFTCYGLPAN